MDGEGILSWMSLLAHGPESVRFTSQHSANLPPIGKRYESCVGMFLQ